MKLLRTIRLDESDRSVFPIAAEAGDWAISGAFVFGETPLAELHGKALSAFRSGFLGVPSLGWATLAQIVEADAEDRATAIALLTRCFIESFGAPDEEAARRAAIDEIDFAASLCEHPLDTLIAVERRDQDGAIHEAFRIVSPGGRNSDGGEMVDLVALARGEDK